MGEIPPSNEERTTNVLIYIVYVSMYRLTSFKLNIGLVLT